MIRIASHTEVGGHAKNEDSLVTCLLPDGSGGFLCALADGQGGRAGGARAAEVACRTCLEMGLNYRTAELLFPVTWSTILRKADQAVNADTLAGFTTLIAFCVTPEFVCGASCGDSATVLQSPGKPGQILTARQFKNPPVGSGDADFVPFVDRLETPWTLLAMSDGVWKYAGWENILNLDTGHGVEEIVAAILAEARLPNGGLQDDFTLVAFQGRVDDGSAGRQGSP